jgi:hypothetical protein
MIEQRRDADVMNSCDHRWPAYEAAGWADRKLAKREAQLCASTRTKCGASRRNFGTTEPFNRSAYAYSFYGESLMKTYIAFLAAALVSTAAFAQQEPQNPPASTNAATTPPPASVSPGLSEIFDKLDTNHDGKLSQEEAQAAPTVATNFAAADRDHDGTVSKEEFLSAFKAGPQ